MAEANFKAKVEHANLSDKINTESAGTAGYHLGKSPDHRTIEVLERNGIKTSHKGQKINEKHLDLFDHIVVMDEENFEYVHNMYHKEKGFPPAADKLFLLRDFDPEVRGVQIVPDPYYGNKKDFDEVYTIIDRSNEALLAHLIEKHQLYPDDTQE